MLYHVPDSRFYEQTVAEVWFDSAESAEAAGFQLPPSQRDDATDKEGSESKDPRDIIIEPVVSEKSYGLIEQGVYTFRVDPRASKPEIHDAVEAIWGVTVAKVNTLNRQGKSQRNRRTNRVGKRADTKRAIVTLAPGNEIPLFEN